MSIEAYANPSVLAWARQMAGLELEDAAHKVGVKLDRLESWERGQRRPTIMQLRKLADVYKRPLALFFLAQPPPNEVAPSDFRRFDPQAGEPLSPELRLAIRDARVRREAALELLDELDEQAPQFGLYADLSENPEDVGARVRNVLTGGAGPTSGDTRLAFNFWRTAAEAAGVLVFQAEDVGIDEMRGLSIAERPLPAVVLNIKDAYAGRSFSLLHELTHVLLNRGGLCLLEEAGPRTLVQRLEAFCNRAAGAALVPAETLLREPETPKKRAPDIPDTDIDALSRRYAVSAETVLRRLVILDRVALEFYRRKREEYQRQYQQLRQRPAGGFPSRAILAVARAGKLFTQLVLEAYDSDRITGSDVADLLGERLKHLERIRGAVERAAEPTGELT